MRIAHTEMLNRRPTLKILLAGWFATIAPAVFSQQAASLRRVPKNPPVWTSFGLNGSPDHPRFALTRSFVESSTPGRKIFDSEAFAFMRNKILPLLQRQRPPLVQFKQEIAFGEDLVLGFAHDFEIAVGARMMKNGENLNTLVVFMSGVGLIMALDDIKAGWRIVSSFPFKLRVERPGGDLKDVKGITLKYYDECYTEYAGAFSLFVSRFNKWDQGYSKNIFARLTKVDFHKDAKTKLTSYGVDKFFDDQFVGFLSSTYICDNLNIPLLPFRETDASFRYAALFKDSLKAQDTIKTPDADLRFEIIVRDTDKTLIPSRQSGVTIIRRKLVLNVQAFFDDVNILKTFTIVEDEDAIPYGSTEDDTPDRDLIFFERLLNSTLSNLFAGIVDKNPQALAKVSVKMDYLAPMIPRFIECCSKVR